MLTENNLKLGGHDRYLPKEVVLGYHNVVILVDSISSR